MLTRRQFARGCLAFTAAAVCRAGQTYDLQPLAPRIDGALARAVSFVAAKQNTDGAWRSEVYGPLKDGPSLTAFVAAALMTVRSEVEIDSPLAKAIDYLAAIDVNAAEITYPVYAAAGAVTALSRQAGRSQTTCDNWLTYLRRQQLDESLGWIESDLSYGGWSFAHAPPQPVAGKPASPLATPNLSATVFAIDALRSAGCPSTDPAIQRARIFIQRCQNWADDSKTRDARFDDGGFFFVHDDSTRNKPGEAGIDAKGRLRYASYGSTTADGLRALVKCGLPADHPRVVAAHHWLLTHFSAEKHPGPYPPDREYLRQSLYYYYCSSAAKACRLSAENNRRSQPTWACGLADALLSRQLPNGCWANPAVDVREDDPLVATPLAISALHECQAVLRGNS